MYQSSVSLQIQIEEGSKGLQLLETRFYRGEQCMVSRRGKAVYGHSTQGHFQWSKAVRALTALSCLTAASVGTRSDNFVLTGGAGSLAASLDYAVSKCPQWTIDMFGCYSSGAPVVRRLFMQSNPGRKLGGDVAVSFNRTFLDGDFILVVHGNKILNHEQVVKLSMRLIPSLAEVSSGRSRKGGAIVA